MSRTNRYDHMNTNATKTQAGPTALSWKHEEPYWKAAIRDMPTRFGGGPAPAGPWDNEPDKVQWVDEATGLDCLAVRNPMGAWCGYVGVAEGHPYFGKDYGEVSVDVHGGLTFANSCDEEAPEGFGICHAPFPGRPANIWWLGFDCGHAWDLIPGHRMPFSDDATYRDLTYVQNEIADLARQIKERQPVTDEEVKEVFGQ